MTSKLYDKASWPSAKEAFEDMGIHEETQLVLVDSDCILYPTAFTKAVTDKGSLSACEIAVNTLLSKTKPLYLNTNTRIIQFFTSSGSPKFRDQFKNKIAYKENRKTSTVQPMYVDEIRGALSVQSDTIICDPLVGEADDYISIFASEASVRGAFAASIIGTDKDLLQIPGIHYRGTINPKYVTCKEGNISLYRQILSGDSADNIPGLKGVGKKIAENIIPDHTSMTEAEMFERVISEYSKRMEGTIDEISDYLFETGNLVYLRRDFDDYWNPPVF